MMAIMSGSVSATKFTTVDTSCSSLLSMSPLWMESRPWNCERSMVESMRCCILFCALMPRMLRTHTAATLSSSVLSISAAIISMACMMLPSM